MKDYRENQKVIATLVLDDKGQDFLEIDVLENGVILGESIMFEKGKLTMIGIGALDGERYWTFEEMKDNMAHRILSRYFIYFKDTKSKKEPVPWEANTLKYRIVNVKKPKDAKRFLIKKEAKK